MAGPAKTAAAKGKVEDRVGHRITEQGFYKAVRGLRQADSVLLNKGVLQLHQGYIEKLSSYLRQASSDGESLSVGGMPLLSLSPGDRISYRISSAHEANHMWSHLFGALISRLDKGDAIYTYVPHDWLMLAYYEDEVWQIGKASRSGHPYLSTTGNNTKLDKHTRKLIRSLPGIQNNNLEKPLFENNRYYLNIFGDMLLEFYLDQVTADAIDDLYLRYATYSSEAQAELMKIIKNRGKNGLVVSHNAKKAARLKKKLEKGFVL